MMNYSRILSGLLAAGLIAASAADAAPAKKSRTSKKKQAKTVKKEEKAPALPLIDHPSAPQNHEAEYQNFAAQLKEITKNNAFDISRALFTILKATDDEFCIEWWMQRAAHEGLPPAQLFMAQKHLYLLPKDKYRTPEVKEAVALLKKASDAGYVPAMQEYSKCMRHGIGTLENDQGADRLLMQACSGGSFETRFEWLKQSGRLEKYEDLQRAEVKAEIERGNHYILHHMSLMAPDTAAITNMLVQAAGKGNSSAFFELSELYTKIDITKSYKFLREAVRLRNPDALYRIGMYMIDPPPSLEINVGPVRNPVAGIVMLKMAAIMGQIEARAQLARMYYKGTAELPQDATKAYRHLVIGTALSASPVLMAAQGYMLLTGQGTQKNAETGLKLIKMAASRQYTHAKCLLGYIHYHGIGVDKNVSEAVFNFEDASTYKDPLALIYLALLFDAEKDTAQSNYYLEHAEQLLPGKAKSIFRYYQQHPQGWHMQPFPMENI